jgi:hypothetical protein
VNGVFESSSYYIEVKLIPLLKHCVLKIIFHS